ncbi:uncharacterized protein TRAVEDRAFT_46578 [Trametes versicolor FP-101664 SS1]|uniref:uncharacterized protein n=1 Tax=Trametes versicolor (strain FP-101664) TaxID=717944 RepID=UPI0004623B3E|nr:uncharacterized protein TRAVEDRAFT_46578 [Trametes versicolor FP-101664 SS1]EIW59271.1 hypothetical protein TRAVEDRAFT_46578 [Trametes versicolor FP-101664 SS1]
MSPSRSYGRPYVPPTAAPGNPFVTADCSFVRPASQATHDYAHSDGPVARCRGALPSHASLDIFGAPGTSTLPGDAVPSFPHPFSSAMESPSEASAPPYAGSFGPDHPHPLPPASSVPAPPLAPASGPIRTTRRAGSRGGRPTKKPVQKRVTKPTKLTGIIPRPPTPQATPNAAGELVLVCPVGQQYCDFVQAKADRLVDMRRHMNAHFPAAPGKKDFFCNGRPVEDFSQKIFEALPKNLREIRTEGDVDLVGGCGKGFARLDTLQRHLNESCTCESKVYCALVDLEDGTI